MWARRRAMYGETGMWEGYWRTAGMPGRASGPSAGPACPLGRRNAASAR
jgi:hypothetical protein